MEEAGSSSNDLDLANAKRLYLSNGLQEGEFLVGPKVAFSGQALDYTCEYLAKQDNSDSYVLLKVLSSVEDERGGVEYNQEKSLLHNEHLILSLLQDQPGIIQHLGLFKDQNAFILALECLMAHEYDKQGLYRHYVNLQQYIIDKKILKDREALNIFCDVAATVKDLHQKNIVHRDLKLGNIIYNKRTRKVKFINFSMSKHLVRETELLTDQRGSLAYVSPEILSGRPYDGKASDMWAIGVMLYTMMCGQFPFYDSSPSELFKKICTGQFYIPSLPDGSVSPAFGLVKKLIVKDPLGRLSAKQSLDFAIQLLSKICEVPSLESGDMDSQVVPYQQEHVKHYADGVVPDSSYCISTSTSFEQNCIRASLSINSLPMASGIPSQPARHASAAAKETGSFTFKTSSMSDIGEMLSSTRTVSRSSEHLIIQQPLTSNTSAHRYRRKSVESEVRLRRHSLAQPRSLSTTISPRQRRLSHDARDNPREILHGLHCVASRKRSSSSTNAV